MPETIPVGSSPSHVAIAPEGTRAFVTQTGSASIAVIDTTSDTVGRTFPVGASPSVIAVTSNGQRLYVGFSGGQVQVISAASGVVISTLTLGDTSVVWRFLPMELALMCPRATLE